MASVPLNQRQVRVLYINWRGEESERIIIPYEGGLRYGVSQWHTTPQYLLRVYDVVKREYREFAMKDIKKWEEIVFEHRE